MRVVVLHVLTVSMSLTFLRGQAAHMRQRGIDLIATCSPGGGLDDFRHDEGVPVVPVPMTRTVAPFKDIVSLVRLIVLMTRLRPQIVHAHTPKGGLLGMVAATVARVPVRIYHLRGLPAMGATGPRKRLLMATEWISCRLAHRVIAVSHSLRAFAVEQRLTNPDKTVVLAGGSGQGVDANGRFEPGTLDSDTRDKVRNQYAIPKDALVVGFVGRLVRDKGIIELARAWKVLRPTQPSLHLLLVGPWEDSGTVPQQIRGMLEHDSRVHFAGEDWDTPRLYAAMDIVVLPSYREGFPNVPLEAAAMRLPVVATRVPGCIDAVVDGETGMLVEPGDSLELAAAINCYVTDAGLRAAHGNAGRERAVTYFQREVIWQAIADQYTTLLDRTSA